MTTQQIAWAKTHDWFISYGHEYKKGQQGFFVTVKDDRVAGNTLVFTKFDALKHWAGY